MAFQSSVTDEQIEDYLHTNVGDFRPDWESLYFDLVGMGEMVGLAQISKRAATKMLAKDFKKILSNKSVNAPLAEIPKSEIGVFRNIIKGVRKAPKEILDPISEIHLKPELSDALGRTFFGRYGTKKKDVGLGMASLKRRAEGGDLAKAINTLYHELGHGMQDRAGLLASHSRGFIEAHAEDFAYNVESALKTGKPLNMDFLQSIYAEGFDRVTSEAKKGYNYGVIRSQTKAKRNVGNLGDLVEQLGGETFFSQEYKVGDMIDVPGVGKVKYDADQAWFEGGKPFHQYTIQEGPARGATIGSYVEGLEELTEKALETVKKFSEGFHLKDIDF